jgi:hypothetical protein
MRHIGAFVITSAILVVPLFVVPASASPLSLGARAIPAADSQTAIIVPVFRGGAVAGRGGGVRPGWHGAGVALHGGGVWRRPANYWWRPGGAIAAGAAIGVVSAATAAAWAGAPPAPDYCWYYTDESRRQGFWDVCS